MNYTVFAKSLCRVLFWFAMGLKVADVNAREDVKKSDRSIGNQVNTVLLEDSAPANTSKTLNQNKAYVEQGAEQSLGALELTLLAGEKPWDGFLIVELRQGNQWVAAATTKKGNKVVLNGAPGKYSVHILLADGQPIVIPNLLIQSGVTTQQTIALSLGELLVEVDFPPFYPGVPPYPNIAVSRQGAQLWQASESGNPASFIVPAASYTVQVSQPAANIYLPVKETVIRPGEKVKVRINR